MICRSCYKTIADDSVFCPYCGKKVEKESPFDVSFAGARRAEGKTTAKKVFKVIGIVVAVLLALELVALVISSFIDADSKLTPLPEPESGEILSGCEVVDYYTPCSTITVTAPRGKSCVVKMKTIRDCVQVCFYIRAGETVTIQVPRIEMTVYFATGDTWYGEDLLFGSDTNYYKDATITDFSEGTWEYTLIYSSEGNFSQTPIDKEEFEYGF